MPRRKPAWAAEQDRSPIAKPPPLAQSIAREPRPVAWVSLDEGDNDPVVLLAHVAVAVDRVLPLTPALFAMLSSPGTFEPIAINRVCSELSTLPEHVLVLDDVQLVSGSFSRDAIAALALHVGQGSQTVLSGRRSHGLPIARLRANGGLLEIGAADLALDAAETRSVLEHAGVSVSDDDSALLAQRTEGWAIAVYLAALSLDARGRMDDALTAFTGTDRYVVDICAVGVPGGPCAGGRSLPHRDGDSRPAVRPAVRRGAKDHGFRT